MIEISQNHFWSVKLANIKNDRSLLLILTLYRLEYCYHGDVAVAVNTGTLCTLSRYCMEMVHGVLL